MPDVRDTYRLPADSDRPEPPNLDAQRRTRPRVTGRQVTTRRLIGALVLVVPLVWALGRALPVGHDIVNRGGARLIGDLLGQALSPRLDGDFLRLVLEATGTTLAFAAIGTAGALVIGLLGGLVLSDVAWTHRPPRTVRAVRVVLRGLLVATRSIHELVWALLLVSVLGLDPLVAVLAIALPFGAQTAQVFGDTFDGLPTSALHSLRNAGATTMPAVAFALLPPASPLMLSYAFYRFECAVRSTVLLGAVGVGGLGQELVVSLSSRNWDEVWTLIAAVIIVSALVDAWSGRLRADMAVASCSEWSAGAAPEPPGGVAPRRSRSRWARWSALAIIPGLVAAWLASGVSLSGLTSSRTRALTGGLVEDLLPPKLPAGGWSVVGDAVLDTLAMAVVAMAIAVLITVVIAPWAVTTRAQGGAPGSLPARIARRMAWALARIGLLVLRSVPPTVWAVIALLALFPGILPGALALGVYTGGVLGRLVAESWESVSPVPRNALLRSGVPGALATLAAVVPASAHQLLTYTLYRFEICVRETAVVGIVGAAGLGRLLSENLNLFRFPVVSTLLIASFAVSVSSELLSRRLRRAIRA
ncbi:ABC transporter permease [uncultured Nocardioides sp.]|uniref:Phosphonate ABC transporter permease protein phnE n=1 Tax=uncultured Nocardioides sp. TaxID=198441 RepID=A0A6J4N2H3_9ACTN|nr:ABC transporter permease subunit [uncultured Nocardioides sp.]CAA9375916.1 MAG: Phosphonate ABC transporter permease protein phnE [uncultured Nocardioides sp.]